MSFKKFLTKHAGELSIATNVIGSIVGLLPIGRQDREQLSGAIRELDKAADNIAKAAAKIVDENGAVDRDTLKDVVREVVKELLPDIVGGAVEAKARKAVKKAPAKAAGTAKANKG